MTDSAQDYTYNVLEVDSSGLALIRITSYDSLTSEWNLQLTADDSDGSIEKFVADHIDVAINQFNLERQPAPTITLDTPVSGRWKPRVQDTFPIYNFLTQFVDSYDSETNDLITTHYSVRPLTDSEKVQTYSTLSIARSDMLHNLFSRGYLDNIESDLSITDVSDDSDEVTFKHQSVFEFGEPTMQRIQASLSLNDSDFAKLFVAE